MKIDQLLSSLRKVKSTGKNSWVAACPSHSDKSPSLAIELKPDTILVHCFAGCSIDEVLGSVGMEVSDLYPVHDKTVKPGRISARSAMECVIQECYIVAATTGIMRERLLTDEESKRLFQSSGRIMAAMEMSR